MKPGDPVRVCVDGPDEVGRERWSSGRFVAYSRDTMSIFAAYEGKAGWFRGGQWRYPEADVSNTQRDMPAITDLKQFVVDVPDFPKPGILFRDINVLLREHFGETLEVLDQLFTESEWDTVDLVAGVESRGFILASALASRRGKGFLPIRKKGKLPPPVVDVAYSLEYGSGVLEMQPGSGRVLLIDDVLATGGTLKASGDLCTAAGYSVQGIGVLIDLKLVGEFSWGQHTSRAAILY